MILRTAPLACLAFVAASLTGCAHEPDAARADAGAPVCSKIYPVGSNLPTTRCVSAQQAAEEKRQMEQNPIHVPSNLQKATGGG